MPSIQTVANNKPAVVSLPLQQRWAQQLATVPGRLKFARAATIAAAVLFVGLSYLAYADLRNAVQTVGRDTVPSIVAAEKIRATLADANANVVNFFLTGEADDGPSWTAYRREMDEVQNNLLVAAQNITYGDEERAPILDMTTQLASYERLIGQARGHRQGDFHVDLDAAELTMRNKILSAAVALDKANFDHLTATYSAHRSGFGGRSVPMIASGILLFGLLLSTQFFLAQRTRRTINPGLAAATIALATCALYAATVMPRAEANLKSAKEDAFDSIHALWQARATAFDANADESFYLLDHGNSGKQAEWTKNFVGKASLLAEGNPDQMLKAASAGTRFKGYIGDELANITFDGEKEAALEMTQTWGAYIAIDQRIRELESTGKYKEALALDIGVKPGESNWAFGKFDEALGKTLDLNQHEFDLSIDHAFQLLAQFVYLLALALLVIVVATVFGLKARIDEYRFQ
jgi:hypothetical protein